MSWASLDGRKCCKEFIDEQRSTAMGGGWDGDRIMQLLNRKIQRRLNLFARIRLADIVSATRFFTEYSGALEKKYRTARTSLAAQFPCRLIAGQGNVFLRCSGRECITSEGAVPQCFLQWTAKLNWRLVPESPQAPASTDIRTAQTTPWRWASTPSQVFENHSRQSASLDSV